MDRKATHGQSHRLQGGATEKHRGTRRMLPLIIVFALLLTPGRAQDETEYRMEMGAAAGLNFSLNDANSKFYGDAGAAGGLLLRFLLNPRMAVKASATYAKLSGSTAGMNNFYPAQPDVAGNQRLDFKVDGAIYDISAIYELHFLPYGFVSGYQGFHRLVPYIQMGLGFTYSDAGKAATVNIPVGVGVKYKIGPRLNLGLEWRMHFTPSDKLEGLEAPLGIKSSAFRNKDHYSFTLLTLTYEISPRCPNCNKD